MFRNVYEAINNEASLRRIVKEFLEDCIKDNVTYVELRTTPRKLTDVNSRRDYVRIVVDEISSFENLHSQRPLTSFPTGKIAARLILTVDRTQPVSVAEQTVDIALRFSEWVVGLDFAGNPTVGTFADFLGVFERARGHGLFTTVHTSEIRNVEEETEAIVNFRPDRVGHFLFPTADQISKLVSAGIAIESCPTSNICAISGKSPTDGDVTAHSIIETFINTRPDLLSINTDDPGVFGVSLSDELRAVAQSFNLDQNAIQRMIVASARHAFLTKQERESLASVLSM
jgi:adenosine deaminase